MTGDDTEIFRLAAQLAEASKRCIDCGDTPEADGLCDEMCDVANRILALRAETVAGIAVKVDIRWLMLADDLWDEDIIVSISRDLGLGPAEGGYLSTADREALAVLKADEREGAS